MCRQRTTRILASKTAFVLWACCVDFEAGKKGLGRTYSKVTFNTSVCRRPDKVSILNVGNVGCWKVDCIADVVLGMSR